MGALNPGGKGPGGSPQTLSQKDWQEEVRRRLEEKRLADFKYSKGCKTEKGLAPSRKLLRTDPGPAGGKLGQTALPKKCWGGVLAEESSSPVRETFLRISAREGSQRGLLASLPPKAGIPPQISSRMASGLCLEGTGGSFQHQLPRHRPRRVGTIHQPLSKGEQKSKPSASDCPSTGPGRAFQKVAPAPRTWRVALPRGSVRETAEQRGSNRLLASGEQR